MTILHSASDLASALSLDASDAAPARDRFEQPPFASPDFDTCAYFAGNSLGLLSTPARDAVNEVLTSWSTRAVHGHFEGPYPWQDEAARIAGPLASIVGASAHEVVAMNTLTINLHLLLAALYIPTAERSLIAIEGGAFPSDDYAVASQVAWHGLDPSTLMRLDPSDSNGLFTTSSLIDQIRAHGASLAAVVLGAINFRTGQLLDVAAITAAAHEVGALAIWDLAHAVGNVEMRLHDWDVDAAIWCNYKYLNSGPGAVGGAFIHERFASRSDLPRLNGWYGNNPATRFAMYTDIDLDAGASGWQVSNPPAIALAPVRASVEMFSDVGFASLQARSKRLTAYLESLFDSVCDTHQMTQLTPRSTHERGAQLSMLIENAPAVAAALAKSGVVADERPPNIVRFAPIPLYTSYVDCWRAADALTQVLPRR
jgi:kynureninase